jgi:O-antigen/teichoic acid export membrane protein
MSGSARAIGGRAVRGAFLLTISTYIALVLGIAARKVLAIVLDPLDFGLMQTALSFVDIVLSFASFSFSSAIINARENLLDEPLIYLRENIFLLTFTVNGLLVLVAITLAAIFPSSLGGTLFLSLVGVYAVQRYIASFDTFYSQILERELDYSKISRATLISNFALHILGVIFAVTGGHAWSIPLATLISTLVSLAFHRYYALKSGLHAFDRSPWDCYNKKTMKWLWSFGFKVMLNRLYETWLFRIDNLLVAALFGTVMLGYYSQAFTIAQMPAIALAPVVARVSIAAYAEIQHDSRRLEEAFAFTNFFLIRLLIPAAIFLIVANDDLVRLFLSSSWGFSAPPLAALAGFAIAVPLFENAKMLLGAKLRLREISIVRSGQLAALVASIVVFKSFGMIAVALAVSGVSIVGYIAILFYVRREVRIRTYEIFALPLIIGLSAALIFIFAIEPLLSRVLESGTSLEESALRILILGVLILASTLGTEYLLEPETFTLRVRSVLSRVRAA